MTFHSKLETPVLPINDVFNYIFYQGRRQYTKSTILYKDHDSGKSLTYDELEKNSLCFARMLSLEYMIGPNDCVTILAQNSIHYPIAFFAILAIGATVSPVPIQEGIDVDGVIPRLRQARTKLIITDDHFISMSETAAIAMGGIPTVRIDAMSSSSPVAEHGMFKILDRNDMDKFNAFIFRTSGSSGMMKSVLISHAHWISTLLTTKLLVPTNTDPNHDTWLLSLSFSYGIIAKLYLGLNILLGIPVVILQQPLHESSLSLVDYYNATFLFLSPPLAARIAKTEYKAHAFKSIKWLLCAGASVHTQIRDSIQTKFHGVPLTLEWGTTETLLLALQIDEASSLSGSSGTLVHGVEANVIDPQTGKQLGVGEQGEILVRNSMCRFAGYLSDDQDNKEFDNEGWYHSGDLGYLDGNSNVFIVDRLKEFLRVGDGYGTRISATEIEAELFVHPAIAAAVVVGVKDEASQREHPTAFLVLQKAYCGGDLKSLADEINVLVKTRLGASRELTGGVFFVNEYPRTGFKIDKRSLRRLVHAGGSGRSNGDFIEVNN